MRLAIIVVLFIAYVIFLIFLFVKIGEQDTPRITEPFIEDSLLVQTGEADNLLAEFMQAFNQGDYDRARRIAAALQEKYPGSPQAEKATQMLAGLKPETPQPVAYKTPTSSKPKTAPATPATRPAATSREQPASKPEIGDLSAKIQENEARLQDALSRMRKERDDRQGITWYFNKNVSHYVYKNSFEAYIGQSDAGEVWLRLRIYFTGENPLNINSYQVYADDREYSISTLYGNMEQGSGPRGYWEWYDMQVSPKEMKVINEVMIANRNAVRYIGSKGIWERAMTEGEKLRLSHVMEAYNALLIQKELLSANVVPGN